MWTNYFLTTLRTFRKNGFYMIANLLSLAIGFSICTVGSFNWEFNGSFNKFFTDGTEIYKVNLVRALDGQLIGSTP